MSAMDLVMMNRQLTDDPLYVYNNNGDRLDLSASPQIEQPLLLDAIGSDLLDRSTSEFGKYIYNGIRVPRVTTILEFCSGNREYLMKWAAKLGSNYVGQKQKTLNTGTKVHETIAEYLTSGTTYTLKKTPPSMREEVYKSVNNFMAWYNHVTIDLGWSVEIFASEIPLICPWFGGTADAILIINGRKFVVDFKSSKRISIEYFIQVSAYKWVIDNFYNEYAPIDGVGILRFDKLSDTYEDIFLEMCVQEDAMFICHCQSVFGLALNMFYSMSVLNKETSIIKESKKNESNIGSISENIKKDPVINKRTKAKKDMRLRNDKYRK